MSNKIRLIYLFVHVADQERVTFFFKARIQKKIQKGEKIDNIGQIETFVCIVKTAHKENKALISRKAFKFIYIFINKIIPF